MIIRNNTSQEIVICAGDTNREEPEFSTKLRTGEEIEIPDELAWYISLQEVQNESL